MQSNPCCHSPPPPLLIPVSRLYFWLLNWFRAHAFYMKLSACLSDFLQAQQSPCPHAPPATPLAPGTLGKTPLNSTRKMFGAAISGQHLLTNTRRERCRSHNPNRGPSRQCRYLSSYLYCNHRQQVKRGTGQGGTRKCGCHQKQRNERSAKNTRKKANVRKKTCRIKCSKRQALLPPPLLLPALLVPAFFVF